MATGIVYGNGKVIPDIDRASSVNKVPIIGEIVLLMKRNEFYRWLEKNNRTSKPISQLIEEYESSRYEDNRPSLSKSE